ncbi:MAG: hypothetical protein R8M38_02390 [Mariprofundaceae bacterium]
MRYHVRQLILLFSFILIVGDVAAKDTLESVLATAVEQHHVAINYREIRHLQLLKEPWQAGGRMFVTPEFFIIEQASPQRQLLTADRQRFRLFIPNKGIRRTGMLTSPIAKKSFGLFRPVIRGDRDALEKTFDINFSATEGQWQIELQPKRSNQAFYKRISVKGKSGKPANYMKTEMDDGDYIEWFFEQQALNFQIEEHVKILMDEARGL